MGVTVLFLCGCFTATSGDVLAKGKPPGGPEDPVMYFTGYVVDAETFLPLDKIWVECFYSYPGGSQHDATVTNKGYFKLTPMRVSKSLEYNFFIGTDVNDGFWIEHRVQYLPSVEQKYYLIKDRPGYVYPFAAFSNTPDTTDISFDQETQVECAYDGEIGASVFGQSGFIHYTRADIVTWSVGSHSANGSLQKRVPYIISGECHYNSKLREYTYERVFPIGDMLPVGPSWGSYFDDPYKSMNPSQFIGAYETPDWYDPGEGPKGSHSDATVVGWEWGVNVGWTMTPWLITVNGRISWSHTVTKTDSISFMVTNTDTVPHKYWVYWEGDILHIWRSNAVYPLPWP